jgi:hypothetical protein
VLTMKKAVFWDVTPCGSGVASIAAAIVVPSLLILSTVIMEANVSS